MSEKHNPALVEVEPTLAQLPLTIDQLSIEAIEQLEGSVLLEALRDVASADEFFAKHSSHSSYSRYPSGPGGSWTGSSDKV